MPIHLYVGAYTQQGQWSAPRRGIAHFLVEENRLRYLDTVSATDPSYLCWSGDGDALLAVEEIAVPGQGGRLISLETGADGRLSLRHTDEPLYTLGDHPCHVAVHPFRPLAAVANYSGGNFSLFRLDDAGHPAERIQTVAHRGRGVHRERQDAPHVHCMVFHPDGQRLYAVDLGLDRCLCYRADEAGMWRPAPGEDMVSACPGTGFRHLLFHPNLRFAYVNGEMGNTLECFRMGEAGTPPVHAGTWQTLAPGEQGMDSCTAALRMHPGGHFLYVSNRGADSIAVFALAPDGQVEGFRGTFLCGGGFPRDFVLTPSGDGMIVAHQHSDTIALFRLDPDTGMGYLVDTVPSPVPVNLLLREC